MPSSKYPLALKVGTRLNNDTYEIIKVLGQGGFGITYEARDLHLNRHLAIKELFASDVCGRGEDGKTVVVPLKATKDSFDYQMEKFQGEARILAGLHNKHLVTIYHFFKENGTSYFVMDYVEGKSLRDLLREVHHYDEYTVKDIILEQMLETLDCIHKQNPPLCHLDIKPENIMVDMNDFNLVLIDFGASKYASTSQDGKSKLSSMMVYSPSYAPIEQMSANAKKNMGPWSDFYALGATMYALLTGFDPNEPSEILADPSPNKEKSIPLPPSLSEQMKKLIIWMMSPSRGDRPQSVEEIRRFLGKDVEDARGADMSAGQGNQEAPGMQNDTPFVTEPRKKAFLVSDGRDEFYLFNDGGYVNKGVKYELDESVVTFGRKAKTSTAVVQMEDSKQFMSRIQAEFAVIYVDNQPMVTVKSVNANNLVKVNGAPLPVGHVKTLGDGDRMTMGDKTITLTIE